MNKTYSEALQLFHDIKEGLIKNGKLQGVIKIIAPPYPFIHALAQAAAESATLLLAAQNCAAEESGAFTGEVSAAMIESAGARYVIIGHSERRTLFGETATTLKRKTGYALKHNLIPIFCIGESAVERKSGKQFELVTRQLEESLFHLSATDFQQVVIAYEPVWAIGTGVTATAAQAQEMHRFIRTLVAKKYNPETAARCSILYGGSCNAANAGELFSCPDVDGGLIGGASLKAAEFLSIIETAAA